jgi:hypothetical protein
LEGNFLLKKKPLITSVVTQCCHSRALPYTLCHVMPWQQGITQWGDSNWFITRQNNRWKYHSWSLLLVFISSSCKLQQSCPNSRVLVFISRTFVQWPVDAESCVACPNSVHHTSNLFLGSEIFHHPLIYIHPQDYYSVPQSLTITSLVSGLTSFGHTDVLFVGGMHLMNLGDDLMMAC